MFTIKTIIITDYPYPTERYYVVDQIEESELPEVESPEVIYLKTEAEVESFLQHEEAVVYKNHTIEIEEDAEVLF